MRTWFDQQSKTVSEQKKAELITAVALAVKHMHIYPGRKRLTDDDKRLVRKVMLRAQPMRDRQMKRLERSIAVDESGKPTSC
jgi:hypothetical protein